MPRATGRMLPTWRPARLHDSPAASAAEVVVSAVVMAAGSLTSTSSPSAAEAATLRFVAGEAELEEDGRPKRTERTPLPALLFSAAVENLTLSL